MNIQHSSSIEMNSSEDRKDDINEVIVMMNNQFLKVRRPNEENVLEYLNYDQQEIKDKITSKDHTMNLDTPQQALLESRHQNQSYFELPKIHQTNYNSILQSLIEERNQEENRIFQRKHQMILNDLSCNYSPLDQQQLYNKTRSLFKELFNIYTLLYFIIGVLLIFECSITISYGEKSIYHLLYYVILYILLIIETILLLKNSNSMVGYDVMSHIIIFILVIINSLIDFQYISVLLLGQIYPIVKKYHSLKKIYEIYIEKITILEIVFMYFIFIHFTSCIFVLISNSNQNSWIQTIDNEQWQTLYSYSLYWSISIITHTGQDVIKCNNLNEIILTIIVLMINIILIIYLIINNQSILFKHEQFQQNLDILSNYFKKRNISKKLQTEIQVFLQNKWIEKYLTLKEQEQGVLQQLPQYMDEDLKIELFSQILQKIPFFQQISQECYKDILLQLKEFTLQNNENLDKSGLYYCLQGEFELYLPNNIRLQGNRREFYGIKNLFYDKQDVCQAISINRSNFVYLSRYQFLKVLKKYPIDYQCYRMLVESNELDSGQRCEICQSRYHDLEQCPDIHLVIDRLQLICTHLASQDMIRQSNYKRKKDRSTNAVFTQRLYEDAASMYQENYIQEETIQEIAIIPPRKKSKSLNSDENSKQLQKSNSGHSLSAIQKPQGSGMSFSTFSMFKEVVQGQRKISKHQDSDKISNNSKQPQSSSNSFKELPIAMEDKIVDDSIFITQQRNKKQTIGKQGTTSIKITPPNVALQAIPSVSDINTLNEDSFLRQSSKRQSSPQKKRLEVEKELEFEYPMNLRNYFPQYNISQVLEKLKK